jgi:anti-anti-sigma factor
MSAPVSRQNQTTPTSHPAPLRTGIRVSSEGGRLHAVVDLHGELDPASVPQLRCELDQLIADGIVDITVDLQDLRFCTSCGLDLFDEVHGRLEQHRRGALRLRLHGAAHIVQRVVRIVRENDPTFDPPIEDPAATSSPRTVAGAARSHLA